MTDDPTSPAVDGAGMDAGDAAGVGPAVAAGTDPAGVAPAGVASAPGPTGAAADAALDPAADRAALVALCLYAYDRARSAAVAERIEEGLAGVGIVAVRPDGERFDPKVHEAGGVQPTGDPRLDGTVAETELAGFTDRGTVLRAPVVIVHRHTPAGGAT